MANEKAAATLFMVTRWRQYQYLYLLLGARCRWIAIISCLPAAYHLDSSDIKSNTIYRPQGGIPPKSIRHTACVPRMTKNLYIPGTCVKRRLFVQFWHDYIKNNRALAFGWVKALAGFSKYYWYEQGTHILFTLKLEQAGKRLYEVWARLSLKNNCCLTYTHST